MDSLNKLGRLGIIAQGAAQLSNTKFEHTVCDNTIGPDRIEQLGFGHQLPGMGQQMLKDSKRFRFEGNGLLVLPQLLILALKAKLTEQILPGAFCFAHPILTQNSLFSHDLCCLSIL